MALDSVAAVLTDLRQHGDLLAAREQVIPLATEKAGKRNWRPQPRVSYGPPSADEAARIRLDPIVPASRAQMLIAEKLGKPFETSALERWRRAGIGPPAIEGTDRYRTAELDAWLGSLG